MRVLLCAGVAVLALVALKILVVLVEPKLAFFPMAGEFRTPRDAGLDYRDIWIRTRDGETVHGWQLDVDRPRARVLYFHGNGGNLSIWLDTIAALRARRLAVVAFDYRGYGRSSGRPSEAGLYHDADAVVEEFRRLAGGGGAPVVYWGRSLGVAVAAYAAARRQPDALILESGFPDVHSLAGTDPVLGLLRWFARYRFPAARFLAGYHGRVLVMHGDRDSVVPYSQGEALFRAIGGLKQFVMIRGGDHNDLHAPDAEDYWAPILEFIDGAMAGRQGP